MSGFAKLLRFSAGVGPAVFAISLVGGRGWEEAAGLAVAIVACGWMLWGALALTDEYRRVAVFAAETTVAAFAVIIKPAGDRLEETVPDLPAPARRIRTRSRKGPGTLHIGPLDEHRQRVRSFVILGQRVGGFTYREMRNRCLSTGEVIEFDNWRQITDDLTRAGLFYKDKNGGARPAVAIGELLERLGAAHLASEPRGELVLDPAQGWHG